MGVGDGAWGLEKNFFFLSISKGEKLGKVWENEKIIKFQLI